MGRATRRFRRQQMTPITPPPITIPLSIATGYIDDDGHLVEIELDDELGCELCRAVER